MRPLLPRPRGTCTDHLCDRLRGRPGPLAMVAPSDGPLRGEDYQLALHLCFGLHYDGFDGVDEGWEWEPSLLGLRRQLVDGFVEALVAGVPPEAAPGRTPVGPGTPATLRTLLEAGDGPSLSAYLEAEGTADQLREFVILRSVYQRKEADAHTWGIPRLRTRAKSAMVTLQADEYGNGRPGGSHAELFATTMTALDLDPRPGFYVDRVPGVALATDNLVSLFGLHRRWRGALVGHLAAFEMTSVVPMSRYASAVRRLGFGEEAARFYDVHVEADTLHAVIATDELVVGLTGSDPVAASDLAFGTAALLSVEARLTGHLLDCWHAGRSCLRPPQVERRSTPTARSIDLARLPLWSVEETDRRRAPIPGRRTAGRP